MRTLAALDTADLARLACPWCGRTPRGASGGLKALQDGRVIGLVAVAPAPVDGAHAPGAVVVRQLWVAPGQTSQLVGTQLVHRLLRRLQDRGVASLVAGGTAGVPDCRHLPAAWLDKLGFVEIVQGAQWRIDLDRTVRVRTRVRTVAGSLIRLVRPERPAPANRG